MQGQHCVGGIWPGARLRVIFRTAFEDLQRARSQAAVQCRASELSVTGGHNLAAVVVGPGGEIGRNGGRT